MNKTVIISLVTIVSLCSASHVTIAGDRHEYSQQHHSTQVYSTIRPLYENVYTAYEELENYGTWHDTRHFGLAWHPTVELTKRSWHPYRDDGSWTFSNGSREWMSHYSWGYIVFNTADGSWRNVAGSWYWVPERDWRGFRQAIVKVPTQPIRHHEPDQDKRLLKAMRKEYIKATRSSDYDYDRHTSTYQTYSPKEKELPYRETKPLHYDPAYSKHLPGRKEETSHSKHFLGRKEEPSQPKLPPLHQKDYRDAPNDDGKHGDKHGEPTHEKW